jgi:hypothetical protein
MNRFNRTDYLIIGSIVYLIGLYLLVQYQTTVSWGPEGLDIMMSWCQEGLEHFGVSNTLECVPNETIEINTDNLLTVLREVK